MKLGAIIVLVFIIFLLCVTLFCVRRTILDDRAIQEEYEERQKLKSQNNGSVTD